MTDQTSPQSTNDQLIALWLFAIALMVFIMVVLGGVTRLTESGLSMVEWRPVTGWLPPLSDTEWLRVFEKYQVSPEFKKINSDMTVSEFKGIFWLEYLHRLWGRLIGIAFFVPFVFFLIKGWVQARQIVVLSSLFVLGGLQGGMGWFMVKSGLVDRPDVSQYRLAAHLILALIIYGWLIWCGLSFWQGQQDKSSLFPSLRRYSLCVVGLVFVTAFSGALVAGLDAGLSYNTFPLMDGELIPDGLFSLSPFYLNFFENRLTVQFDHRVMAIVTFASILHFWMVAKKTASPVISIRPIHWLAVIACLQVGLGISTLLLVVPITLGALHQAGALVLLGVAVWSAYHLQKAEEDRAL